MARDCCPPKPPDEDRSSGLAKQAFQSTCRLGGETSQHIRKFLKYLLRRRPSTRQAVFTMIPLDSSRRSFLKTSVALAGTARLMDGLLQAQAKEAAGPLIAYV